MVNSQLNPAAATTPMVQTVSSLITEKAEASGVDPVLANKIAFCESSMRQFGKDGQALRGIKNPADVGLFQINEAYHDKQSQKLGYDIHTTEGNIDYAMYLINHEGGVERHWKASEECWSSKA